MMSLRLFFMTQDTAAKPANQSAQLSSAGVRSVAVFEAAKGLIVLAAGFGLLSLLHRDVQAVAESIVRHLHPGPAGHYSEIFIRAAIVSASLYLPVEAFEFWRHHSILGGLIMSGNLLLVAGLLYVRLSEHRTAPLKP
ncbi:MAG: DUF2127 domain-containing protein [Vicinamibacteria bacterium]